MTDYVLEILDGDRAGEVLPLGSSPLRIGRRPENDLVLADEKVSGQHAELAAEGGSYVLRDLGSRNGTFLDGNRVDEVALSVGDTVRIGRVQMRFVTAGGGAAAGAAVGAGGEGLEMTRLDTARRRKSGSGGVLLLAGALVAVAGVGAWWKWGRDEAQGGGPAQPTPPRQVAGNLVDGSMEDLEGWELEAGGDGFQPGSSAHTGQGAMVARPLAAEGAESAGFALARKAGGVTVTSGESLVVRGFVRTSGGAQVALRVWLHGADDSAPSLRGGTALVETGAWTEQTAEVAVPSGCTLATLEVLAWFAGSDGEVWVDDVALTRGGSATALQARSDAGPTLVGCGADGGAAVRSTDAAEPFVVRRFGPISDDGAARGRVLHLSDLGASVSGTTEGDRISVAVEPGRAQGLRLWLPPGTGSSPLVGGENGFAPVADRAAFRAASLLIGSGPTRCMVTFAQPCSLALGTDGDADVLDIRDAFTFDLQVGFQAQRQRAQAMLVEAKAAADAGHPGEALATLGALEAEVPHDTETLAQARSRRGELLDAARAQLDTMDAALQDAAFFRTEGGFQRVRDDLEELVARYAPVGPPDQARVDALRARTEEALAGFAAERAQHNRDRLARLQTVFEAGGQGALAGMIKDYLARHGARKDG